MSDKYLNDEGLEHLVDKIKSLVSVIANTLSTKQNKTLDNSLNVDGTTVTTVENALSALNTYTSDVENAIPGAATTNNLGTVKPDGISTTVENGIISAVAKAPVDTVQDSNMNSVTSNAVYDSLSQKQNKTMSSTIAVGGLGNKTTVEDTLAAIASLIDPYTTTSAKLANTLQNAGNGTINSSLVTGGSVFWRQVGQIVTVQFNALGIPNSTALGNLLVSKLPKPTMGGVSVILCSQDDLMMLGQITQDGDYGKLISSDTSVTGSYYGYFGHSVYMTNRQNT